MKFGSRSKTLAKMIGPHYWGAKLSSLFFLALALVLFMSSSISSGNMGTLRMYTTDFFAPVLSVFTAPVQDAVTTVENVTGLSDIKAEMAALREENVKLRRWYQQAMILDAENKELQKLLNFKADQDMRYVTARVIADSGNAYLRSLLVKAGANDGVSKGQAVIGGEGLIGRIVEAGHNAARVLLLTDVNSRVPVVVGDMNARAILSGNNNGLSTLDHLPLGTELKAGMKIMTSGHGGVLPYGLPVGEVVANKDGSMAVKIYENADRLTHVRILDNGQAEQAGAAGAL